MPKPERYVRDWRLNLLRIVCDNVWCCVEKGDPKVLRPALRVHDPKAIFRVPIHMRGTLPRAALRKDFYNKSTKTFPAGLLSRAVRRAERRGETVEVVHEGPPHKPVPADVDASALFDITLRPDQLEDATLAIKSERGIFSLATNYGKSVLAGAIVYHLFERAGIKSIVIVPNTTLLRQTADDFRKFFGSRMSVGQVGDGVRKFGDVTFVTIQSAVNASKTYVEQRNSESKRRPGFRGSKGRRVRPAVWDKELAALFDKCGCLLFDELHHAASMSGQIILRACPARFRFGMSGTTETEDPARDMAMRAFIGPLLITRRNSELMDRGISARVVVGMVADPKYVGGRFKAPRFKKVWKMDRIWGVRKRIRKKIDPRTRYKIEHTKMLEDAQYAKAITIAATECNRGGLKPLVITTSLPHLHAMEKMFKAVGLNPYVAWGRIPAQERLRRVAEFERDPQGVLLGNVVFDEGLNAASIGVLILASGGASVVRQLQRVGRAIRKKKKGLNYVLALDFWPINGQFTAKHAKSRMRVFKEREKFEVRHITDLVGFLKKARAGWRGILGQQRYEQEVSKQHAQSSKA